MENRVEALDWISIRKEILEGEECPISDAIFDYAGQSGSEAFKVSMLCESDNGVTINIHDHEGYALTGMDTEDFLEDNKTLEDFIYFLGRTISFHYEYSEEGIA